LPFSPRILPNHRLRTTRQANKKMKKRKKSRHRKPGGQPGHKGANRDLVPPETVDLIREIFPESCERCHKPFHLDGDGGRLLGNYLRCQRDGDSRNQTGHHRIQATLCEMCLRRSHQGGCSAPGSIRFRSQAYCPVGLSRRHAPGDSTRMSRPCSGSISPLALCANFTRKSPRPLSHAVRKSNGPCPNKESSTWRRGVEKHGQGDLALGFRGPCHDFLHLGSL
jgi:hypothetical protein